MHRSPHAEPHPTSGVVALDSELLSGWPLPVDDEGDKFSRGTVLIVGGSAMTPGAVLLAGRAALRMGAGRLQIATVSEAAVHVAVALPEAMVLPFDTTPDDRFLESVRAADAVVVGSGMVGDDVAPTVEAVLRDAATDSIIVLDAAAIGAFDGLDSAVVARARSRLVMTPNRQEVRSLLGDTPTDDDDALSAAARRTGAVLTSFGRVHAPDGRRWESTMNALGLGTSGSGDVLAGLVGGAAARCADRAQAACWGTYAHHRAGHALQSRVGVLGYLATDLLDEVPACLQS